MSFVPKGIVPPVITPVDSTGKFDEKAFRRVIRHIVDNGVHGVFVFGTTGEFYAFSQDEYRHILEVAMDEVAGKVPVYGGANSITPRGAIELAHMCEDLGVDALSVLTPMFVSQTQPEVEQFYRTIAANTSLPILVYNNKPKTNVTVEPATMAKLAQVPNIVGAKDSTGDMTNTAEYIRLTRDIEDFHVMMGRDTLIYSALCHGAAGSIAATANVAPRLVADIYDKYMAGDLQGSLDVGYCAAPIGRLTTEEQEKLKAVLKGMELL